MIVLSFSVLPFSLRYMYLLIDRLCECVCTSVIMLKVLLILLYVSLPSVFLINCEVLY